MCETATRLAGGDNSARSMKWTDGGTQGFVTRAIVALNDGSMKAGDATIRARISAVRLFSSLHGDPLPDAISRDHVEELIDLMVRGLSNLRSSKHQIALRRSASDTTDPGSTSLSPNSIRRHLNSLAVTWQHLRTGAGMSEPSPNPFVGHDLPEATQWKSKGLSRSELARILSLPVFTQHERPRGSKGESCYWMPLLMLLTGANPEQVANLSVSNFYFDLEIHEGLLLKIGRVLESNENSRTRLRTGLKTSCSRVFPVPLLLIELGLISYIAWLRDQGYADLFPELIRKGVRHERFPGFELWWEGYLRSNGAAPKGCRPARAFQRTWTTRANECGVSQIAQDYILGREKVGESAWDRSLADSLGSEILKVSFQDCNSKRVAKWHPAL
jgi:integrase